MKTQAQLKEMATRYYELQRLVDLVDEELISAVGGVWLSCDICGDVGLESKARRIDIGYSCPGCWPQWIRPGGNDDG